MGSEMALARLGVATCMIFYHSIGMPVNMKELGIEPTNEQIHEMALSCGQACGGSKGSAKLLYVEDMEAIYQMAKGY